jgi:hypothetical protein
MWAACVVAAIALSAAVFMLRFLVALLREGAPSACYWVVPIRRETGAKKRRRLEFPSRIHVDGDFCRTESDNGDYYRELENENRAKECASGLIAIDVCSISDGLGWRSIRSRGGNIFQQHRL